MKRGAARTLAVLLLLGGWTAALTIGGFAAHMTAHVIAVAVAAPLLALGVTYRPGWLLKPMSALLACGVELVVVWGWHVPWLHAAARAGLGFFALEQLTFLAAGYGVWASVLPAFGDRRPGSTLPGVGALLLTSMHMTLLGALLTVSATAWYGHGTGADAVWDQQLGGVIMLSVGGVAYLSGALGLLARVLGKDPAWRDAR